MIDPSMTKPKPAADVADEELHSRRRFLIGLGRWSKVVIGAAVFGGLALPESDAEAGWNNRHGGDRGGGSWINRNGGGGSGGSWINRNGGGGGGGGSWINRRGDAGGGWVNRHRGGGGGSWINRH